MQAGHFMLVPVWGGIQVVHGEEPGQFEWLEECVDEIADELWQGASEKPAADGHAFRLYTSIRSLKNLESDLVDECARIPLLLQSLAAYPGQLLNPMRGYGKQHVLYDELRENPIFRTNPGIEIHAGCVRDAIKRAEMRVAACLLEGAWRPLRSILETQERAGWKNGSWYRAQMNVGLLAETAEAAIEFLSKASPTQRMISKLDLLKRTNLEFQYRPPKDAIDRFDFYRAAALHLQMRKTAVVIEKFFKHSNGPRRDESRHGGRHIRALGPIRAGRMGR